MMKRINKHKRNIFTVVMFVVTALYIAFIWLHSTATADDSTVESTNVLTMLNNIMLKLNLPEVFTDFIVRKSAHFCEFALLGCLSAWTAYLVNEKIVRNFLQIGFVCLGTAVIDEFIQLYSEGRSSQVTDVVLDFSGSVAGVIFFILVFLIIRLLKK